MLKIQNSSKFRKEYEFYKNKIEKISYPDAKTQALKLLLDLRNQCIAIDEGHSSRNSGVIDPKRVRENIFNLVEIRNSLNQIIKDAGV